MEPLLIRLTAKQRNFIRQEKKATRARSEAEVIRKAIEHYKNYIRG